MLIIAIFFSTVYTLLTFGLLAVSRHSYDWVPSFLVGYLIFALIALWASFATLKKKNTNHKTGWLLLVAFILLLVPAWPIIQNIWWMIIGYTPPG